MRKVLLCLTVAATAVGAVMPAAARRPIYDYTAVSMYQARVVQLQARINRLADRGALSPREADRLRGAAAGLRALVGIKSQNGLNTAERIEIDLRISQLNRQVDREARDGDRRGDGRYRILPVDQAEAPDGNGDAPRSN